MSSKYDLKAETIVKLNEVDRVDLEATEKSSIFLAIMCGVLFIGYTIVSCFDMAYPDPCWFSIEIAYLMSVVCTGFLSIGSISRFNKKMNEKYGGDK